MPDFRIEIVDQYWLEEASASTDLCSHGHIFLKIGETIVQDRKDAMDWTLSTTALQLLRSVKYGHSTETQYDIILHCGQLSMVSCPIGIYFDVKPEGETVHLTGIKKCLSTDEAATISFPDSITIDRKHFAAEVLCFAKTVKAFFDVGPEKIIDACDQEEWDGFWLEYNVLLTFAGSLI